MKRQELKTLEILNKRTANRAFSNNSIPKEIISDLIEAARLTPSCYNNQPWRFIFMQSDDALEKGRAALAEPNRVWAEKAPLLIAAYSKEKDDCALKDGRSYHQFDLGLSVMNIISAATEYNLTARPMAGFSPDKISADFNLDQDDKPLVMLAVGYPDEDQSRLPDRLQNLDSNKRERKNQEEIANIV